VKIGPVTLSGLRALLVPLEPEHLEGLAAAGAAPEIWAHFPWRLDTREAMQAHIERLLRERAEGNSLPFTIVDFETGLVAGSTRFHTISRENRSLEVGTTWLTPSVWRTRINTEAKYLMLRHAFEEWDVIRAQIKTNVSNLRSQAAIERIGFIREGILRQHWILPDGTVRDSVLYSMLAPEWPPAKHRLESRLAVPTH
jgi:RimJ/RimL family protein N-acetyltransferase